MDIDIIADIQRSQISLFKKQLENKFYNNKNSEFYFSSPEDIILNKLKWYEIGNRRSERQWLDVLGVIKVQGNSLDKEYLKNWAPELKIFELLKKAFLEAEVQL